MKGRWFIGFSTALVFAIGMQRDASAQGTVQACPDAGNCVQVAVTGGAGSVGTPLPVKISFKQAPSTGAAGGPDKTAALALTLGISSGSGVPLRLADCTRNADGLPASVKPDASLSNFKMVVENAYCDGGRSHCLCPDQGSVTPDNFINLVVYGPNPLPAPGPNPIDIPTLPAGPFDMVTIDLMPQAGAGGNIPLHVYTETRDSQRPQFTAFLSIGDKVAVDQTCVPVQGQPPCSAGSTSQVAITDGMVALAGGCVGDCNTDGEVTVDDLIIMVNIAQGSQPVSACPNGDANGDDEITIDDILQAVGKALNGCS
jgi:hypothetical protein